MQLIKGLYFPDDEAHFASAMKKGRYQGHLFDAVMKYVKEPKMFYDIGAHVGTWSIQALNAGFKEIHAFEPNPKTYECLSKNMQGKAYLYNFGLAPMECKMFVHHDTPGNTGAVSLKQEGEQPVNLRPIYDKDLETIIDGHKLQMHETLVKIDTEGMEADCIKGMDKIIYAFRPVVIVEQNKNKDAVRMLKKMGMVIKERIKNDWILTWI